MSLSPQSSKKNSAATASSSARRTTVLHLTPDLEPHAEARAVVDLALLTHRGGWKPLIASAGGALVLEAERSAIRHTKMPLNKPGILSAWRNRVQLEALFHRQRPDLIHAHGIEVLGAANSLSAAHHLPLLIDLTEPIPATRRNRRRLNAAVMRGATFRVPTDFMVKHLQQDLQLKSPLLYQIGPGVDLKWNEASRITPERVQSLSRSWRLPETATIVLTATPMAPNQGHKLLLQALAELKRPDIFTVMVGPSRPDFTRELEQQILASGLGGQVVMVDYCADWPAACWLASVMVAVNAVPRGQAQELIVAQALGRPVIATDVGANRELVKGGETAWLIPRDDLNALRSALTEVTQLSGDQRIDLGARTRAFVSENFPHTQWAGALFELYTSVLANPFSLKAPVV